MMIRNPWDRIFMHPPIRGQAFSLLFLICFIFCLTACGTEKKHDDSLLLSTKSTGSVPFLNTISTEKHGAASSDHDSISQESLLSESHISKTKHRPWTLSPSPEDKKLMDEFHLEHFDRLCEDTIYHNLTFDYPYGFSDDSQSRIVMDSLLQLWFNHYSPRLSCTDDGTLRLQFVNLDGKDDMFPVICDPLGEAGSMNPYYRKFAQDLDFDPEGTDSPIALVSFIDAPQDKYDQQYMELYGEAFLLQHLSDFDYYIERFGHKKTDEIGNWLSEEGKYRGKDAFLFIPKYSRQVLLSYEMDPNKDGIEDITKTYSTLPRSLAPGTVIHANHEEENTLYLDQLVTIYRGQQVFFELNPNGEHQLQNLPPEIYDMTALFQNWYKDRRKIR